MAKAILKFNLEDYEDRRQLTRSMKADALVSALYEIRADYLTFLNYADDSVSDEIINVIEKFSDKYFDILKDNNIDLDEIWP